MKQSGGVDVKKLYRVALNFQNKKIYIYSLHNNRKVKKDLKQEQNQ